MDKPELFTEEQVEKVAARFTWIGVMIGTVGSSILWLLITLGGPK